MGELILFFPERLGEAVPSEAQLADSTNHRNTTVHKHQVEVINTLERARDRIANHLKQISD